MNDFDLWLMSCSVEEMRAGLEVFVSFLKLVDERNWDWD